MHRVCALRAGTWHGRNRVEMDAIGSLSPVQSIGSSGGRATGRLQRCRRANCPVAGAAAKHFTARLPPPGAPCSFSPEPTAADRVQRNARPAQCPCTKQQGFSGELAPARVGLTAGTQLCAARQPPLNGSSPARTAAPPLPASCISQLAPLHKRAWLHPATVQASSNTVHGRRRIAPSACPPPSHPAGCCQRCCAARNPCFVFGKKSPRRDTATSCPAPVLLHLIHWNIPAGPPQPRAQPAHDIV